MYQLVPTGGQIKCQPFYSPGHKYYKDGIAFGPTPLHSSSFICHWLVAASQHSKQPCKNTSKEWKKKRRNWKGKETHYLKATPKWRGLCHNKMKNGPSLLSRDHRQTKAISGRKHELYNRKWARQLKTLSFLSLRRCFFTRAAPFVSMY